MGGEQKVLHVARNAGECVFQNFNIAGNGGVYRPFHSS